MARRRVNRKTFQCGHYGFGQWCHRCAQAKACEVASTAPNPSAHHVGTGMQPTWVRGVGSTMPTAQEYADEAARLRKVG